MNDYDHATWKDYVKAKAEELKALRKDVNEDWLPELHMHCQSEPLWIQNKKHYDSVMKAFLTI